MSEKVTGKAFDLKIFLRLIKYAREYRTLFILASISAISISGLAIWRPEILMDTIDIYMIGLDKEGLLNYVLLMLYVLIGEVLLQFAFIYIVNWMGQHIIRNLREELFKHVLHFKMSYLNNSSVGTLVTRVVSDIETIASFFGQGLFLIVSDILKMGVILFIMFYKNWQLTLICISVLPVLIYATKIFQKSIKSAFQQVRNQVSALNSFVQERVTGMKIVQLFVREETEYKNFKEVNNLHKKAHIRTVWYFSIFYPIAEVLSSIAIGLLVWYGGLQTALSSTATIGEIIGFIMLSEMLYRPLRQIADKFITLQMGLVSADRVFKLLDTKENIQDTGSITDELEGNIKFENISFSYKKDELVLNNISFEAKKGETIALVGPTGAGKSTIIQLLNRFYEADSGNIYMDNIKIEEFQLETFRKQVTVVLQDVFLFSDSILNNITLKSKNISKQDVINAAKEIGIHEFIMSLPGDYDYNVKERGAMLSAGQRQLLSFLRAYVSNPKILIMDEATSSIDTHSEQMIQFATNKITKGRTSIIIAHRLSTIKKADKILVMDKGQIVETGSHKELLQIENGMYKELYEKQYVEV